MRKRTFLITLLMISSITFSQTKKFKDIAEVQAFTKKTANDFLNMNFEDAMSTEPQASPELLKLRKGRRTAVDRDAAGLGGVDRTLQDEQAIIANR